MNTSKRRYWILWGIGSLGLAAYLLSLLFWGDDKRFLMPGQLTGGHHQIGIACEACHGESFSSNDNFQAACESCHGDLRKKPFDSHPKAKFKDPRNAELLDKINVLECITCHTEHRPERVHKGGYTQPQDFCIHCHLDIGKERPTHEGLDFNSCNSAGCHNYHNNRALYTDFFLKHLDDVNHLAKALLPQKDYAERLAELVDYPHDAYPVKALNLHDIDAPTEHAQHSEITDDWLTTAHAQSGVTCLACHKPLNQDSDEAAQATTLGVEDGTPDWNSKPQQTVCAQCHDMEVKHFQQGKHGMRLALDLSPMTPAQARLPMHAKAHDKSLDCMSCHPAHRFDVQQAAVEGCLQCHKDEHSLAYKDSPHYALWQQELAGELPAGSGVSCASCHLPRVDMDVNDWMSRVVVQHNQNASLVPNEKMLRPACLHCHGLEFSLNALADEALIRRNFKGQSGIQVDSLRFAREYQQQHDAKTP